MFLLDDLNMRVRTILDQKKMTHDECAHITGFKKAAIISYTNDQLPPIEFIFALVEYLHVRPDFLFFGEEPIFLNTSEVSNYHL